MVLLNLQPQSILINIEIAHFYFLSYFCFFFLCSRNLITETKVVSDRKYSTGFSTKFLLHRHQCADGLRIAVESIKYTYRNDNLKEGYFRPNCSISICK